MEALEGIEAFVRIVESGSFAEAARRMDVPKSTLSRRIGRLEARLGADLLRRTTRCVKVTDIGAAYYERCRQALNQIREAEDAVVASRASPRGLVRVTMPPASDGGAMATLIEGFLQKFSEIELEVHFDAGFVNLIDGGFDVAIRAGLMPDSTLVARKLLNAEMLVFGSPTYLERHGIPDTPEALRDHVCLVRRSTGRRWRTRDGRWVSVHSRLVVNDIDTLRRMARAGLGLAQLPVVACNADIREGRLVAVLRDYFRDETGLYIVYPPSRLLSPAVRVFVDHAIAFFSDPSHQDLMAD